MFAPERGVENPIIRRAVGLCEEQGMKVIYHADTVEVWFSPTNKRFYTVWGQFLADAETMLLRSLQGHPDWPPTYRFLAACYAHMGRRDDAHRALEKLKELTPVVAPAISHWRKPEDREFYLCGLRLAAAQSE